MALDKDTSIKAIVDEVLGEFLEKISISIIYILKECVITLDCNDTLL